MGNHEAAVDLCGDLGYSVRALVLGVNNNDRFNINANDNINNNRPARGMVFMIHMKTHNNLWKELANFDNLLSAYEKASKNKTNNPAVKEFSEHLHYNLVILLYELCTKTYRPKPLVTFVLKDPKTRIICKSNFRDRIVHHALIQLLQPIFEPRFIYDSYASRKGKGTLAAIKRYNFFLRKMTKNGRLIEGSRNNNQAIGYALKCDIKHYFETVDHEVLLSILCKYIKDENVIWLIKVILHNYDSGVHGKGMPLGNWTSQFFANIYLNELDQYVKHELKAKYYIRYVDDFVILHRSKQMLKDYEQSINSFLSILKLSMHPTKCKIIPVSSGINFLGFRIFYHYKLVRYRNLKKIKTKLSNLLNLYEEDALNHETIFKVLHGWNAYAMQGNTYSLRKKMEKELIERLIEIRESKKRK